MRRSNLFLLLVCVGSVWSIHYELIATDEPYMWSYLGGPLTSLTITEDDNVTWSWNGTTHGLQEYRDSSYFLTGREYGDSDPPTCRPCVEVTSGGPLIAGSVTRSFPPGTYYIGCTVHDPAMRMELIVERAAVTTGGPSPPPTCPVACPPAFKCVEEEDVGLHCRPECDSVNMTCAECLDPKFLDQCSYCLRVGGESACQRNENLDGAGCDIIVDEEENCVDPEDLTCSDIPFDDCVDCVAKGDLAGLTCGWCRTYEDLTPSSWACYSVGFANDCLPDFLIAESTAECPVPECGPSLGPCTKPNMVCAQANCHCASGNSLFLDQSSRPGCGTPSCLTEDHASCPGNSTCQDGVPPACVCDSGFSFNITTELCDLEILCANITCEEPNTVCVDGYCVCGPSSINVSGSCEACAPPSYVDGGECVCPRSCSSLESACGDDGCGNSTGCGVCLTPGEICRSGSFCGPPCTPDCEGRECGSDGCGGACGACSAPTPYCHAGLGACKDTVCVSDCSDKFCGIDSCGASCGLCPFGSACANYTCVRECTDCFFPSECQDGVCLAPNTTMNDTVGVTQGTTSTSGADIPVTAVQEEGKSSSAGAIVGGLLGGLFFCGVVMGTAAFLTMRNTAGENVEVDDL